MPAELIYGVDVMPDHQEQIGRLIHRYITTGELIGTEVGARANTQIQNEQCQHNKYRSNVLFRELLFWPWTSILLGKQE